MHPHALALCILAASEAEQEDQVHSTLASTPLTCLYSFSFNDMSPTREPEPSCASSLCRPAAMR